MSRARAKKDRVLNDAYMTPDELALAICAGLRRRGVVPEEVVEPSAGDGAFVRTARATWPDAHVTAVEIDGGKRLPLLQAGAHVALTDDWVHLARLLANHQADHGKSRLLLGNPPYTLAQEHIEAGLDLLRDGDRLAFLLRLNFLGATCRVAFWRRPTGLETIQTIAPRPSFRGSGSDGTEYAVFTWRKGYRGAVRVLPPLVWTPPRRERARRAA